MTKITKDELEEIVEELDEIKGRHTELVTVYIPAGYDVNSVQKQLEAERSTAKNIKSAGTRKNVIDALDKIVRYLKTLKKTPENGLAIFAGNVSDKEGQSDIELWNIEPPKELNSRLYRCDKEFVLEQLKEMLEAEEVFGLLVMDRKEATIGLLEGKSIDVLQNLTSGVPSQVRAGGQCLSPNTHVKTRKKAKRIKDLKKGEEIKALDLKLNKIIFTKVKNKWDVVKDKYWEIYIRELPWPIIASDDHIFFKKEDENIIEVPAKNMNKGDFLINTNDSGELFQMDITKIKEVNKKLEMIDIETESKNFFANWNLVHNSSQRFHRITEGLTKDFYKRVADEMKKIFFNMPRLKGILVGGPVPTKDEFLDGDYLVTKLKEKIIGRVDLGDTSESGLEELVEKSQKILAKQEIIHEKKILERFFETLGEKPDLAVYKEDLVEKALEQGAVEVLILSKDFDKQKAKEFRKKAKNISSEIEIISNETEEGRQFKNLSGAGAILRYKMPHLK